MEKKKGRKGLVEVEEDTRVITGNGKNTVKNKLLFFYFFKNKLFFF